MATNLSIDPDLLDRALKVSGERTKKAAVTKALREFIDGRGRSLRRWRELGLVSADRARMQTCAAEVHGLRLAPERLDEFGKTCK